MGNSLKMAVRKLWGGRILKAEVEKKSDWKVTKTARIQKWREKITASYSAACRWVRGQPEGLTHLETASGEIAVHPQDIVEEVEKGELRSLPKVMMKTGEMSS